MRLSSRLPKLVAAGAVCVCFFCLGRLSIERPNYLVPIVDSIGQNRYENEITSLNSYVASRGNQLPTPQHGFDADLDYFESSIEFLDATTSLDRSQPSAIGLNHRFVGFNNRETESSNDRQEEVASRLDSSWERLKRLQETAETTPSSKNNLLLSMQYLIHGEMLALGPVKRSCSSLQSIQSGWEMLQKHKLTTTEFESSDPRFAVLVETFLAREQRLDKIEKVNIDEIVDENRVKTELLEKFRLALELTLAAESRFQLGDINGTADSYKSASKLLEEIASKVPEVSKEESKAVANSNFPNREPYVFVSETLSLDQKPNFRVSVRPLLEDFRLSKTLNRIASLSELNAIDSAVGTAPEKFAKIDNFLKTLDNSQIDGVEGALGDLIRGRALEMKSIVTVDLLLKKENAKLPAGTVNDLTQYNQEALKAFRSAADKSKTAPLPKKRAVKTPSGSHIFVAYNDGRFVTKRNEEGSELFWNPISQSAEEGMKRLSSLKNYQESVETQLSNRNSFEAFAQSQKLLERHAILPEAWRIYLETGLRTQQNVVELTRGLAVAEQLGVFAGKGGELAQLKGLTSLAIARDYLYSDPNLLKPILNKEFKEGQLLKMQQEKTQKIRNLLSESTMNFEIFLKDQSLSEPDMQRIRAAKSLSLSLARLFDANLADETVSQALEEAREVQRYGKEEIKNVPNGSRPSVQILEALSMSSEAEGLALLSSGDPKMVDVALASIAAANDLDSLVARNTGSVRTGSLLLSAILKRETSGNAEPRSDARSRFAMQLLSEGLLLRELGNDEASKFALRRAKARWESSDIQEDDPVDYVWSVLSDDSRSELDSANGIRMAKLSGLLLDIDAPSSISARAPGDLAFPSESESDETLNDAMRLAEFTGEASQSNVPKAIADCRFPVQALGLALACEAKARASGLSTKATRQEWLNLASEALATRKLLDVNNEQEIRFASLRILRISLEERINSPVSFAQSSAQFLINGNTTAAIEVLYDGVVHHPTDTELWYSLGGLMVNNESRYAQSLHPGITSRTASTMLQAWSETETKAPWQRSLLEAKNLVNLGKPTESNRVIRNALLQLDASQTKAEAMLRAELAGNLAFRLPQSSE